jgi:hypothetical protein
MGDLVVKGIVFTEFMDHVEAGHGHQFLDDVIESSDAETKGGYTAVGTYPCAELVQLISVFSSKTGLNIPEILIGFGKQLAVTFKRDFPSYFDEIDYFDFVECVENRIHVDVLKLYPDAELPRFETVERTSEKLVIDYISSRALEHLALGLFQGTAAEFGESISIEMDTYTREGTRIIRFEILRV